jgi:PDZ domain-containing protein
LVIATTMVALLVVQVVVAAQLHVPWVAIEPGSATPAEQRVAVTGAQTYTDADGEILFLTVRTNRLTALEWLQRSRDPYVDIRREEDVYGTQSPQETRQANLQLMTRSKSNAELVALSYLGYDVYRATGVTIVNTTADSAADGVIQPGEVVTAVDGKVTNTPQQLVDILRALTPATVVTLNVEKGDGSGKRQVQVTLGARPDGSAGGFLGVGTDTRLDERTDVGVDVNIDSGDVGGNSAGLAFALAVIDDLTPGSLTGGHKVAVTGTIELDGSIGEVGGVSQKAVAARRVGAEYMLVPKSLEADAKRYVGDSIKIVPVSTLQEALDALSDLGGNARELALPGATKAN